LEMLLNKTVRTVMTGGVVRAGEDVARLLAVLFDDVVGSRVVVRVVEMPTALLAKTRRARNVFGFGTDAPFLTSAA